MKESKGSYIFKVQREDILLTYVVVFFVWLLEMQLVILIAILTSN